MIRNKTGHIGTFGAILAMAFLLAVAFAPSVYGEEEASSDLAFSGSAGGMQVLAEAEEGTFPEGTTMEVSDVDPEEVYDTIRDLLGEEPLLIRAVDISFIDADGGETEPEGNPVRVSMRTSPGEAAGAYRVVHISDDGRAEIVSEASARGAEFEANSFSIYAIVGADDGSAPKTITYRFFNGRTETQPAKTVIVKKGDVLNPPATPPAGKSGEFTGWYEKATDQLFTGFGPVGEVAENRTVDLYAGFVHWCYVKYHGVSGNVLDQEKVAEGTKITIDMDYPLVDPESTTRQHAGWTLTRGSYEEVSGEFTVRKDTDLWPIMDEGNWVRFDTDGGSHVARQFVSNHAGKAHPPTHDPHKTGYIFDGWYAGSDRQTPYDFDAAVTRPTTIYAKWKPAEDTPYLVVYWIEHQTDAATDTWGYRKAAQERLTGTTGEQTEYSETTLFNEPYNYPVSGFSLNREKSKNAAIKADGSTVINVYYDCNEFTLELKNIPVKDSTETYDISVTRKYTASNADIIQQMDERSGLDFLFDGKHRFSGTMGYVDTPGIIAHMPNWNYSGTYSSQGANNKWYRQFFETLEGAAPDGEPVVSNTSARVLGKYVEDPRTYYLHGSDGFNANLNAYVQATPSEYSGFYLRPDVSDGNYMFGTLTGDVRFFYYPRSGAQHKVSYGLDNELASSKQYSYTDDADGFLDMYYSRNEYDLLFSENGGPDVEDRSVLYEKSLADYEPSGYVRGETKRTLPDGHSYTFDGWYLDTSYTELFGFDYETMPAHDVHLYAHWIPATYTATFDSDGGTYVPPETDLVYGDTVPEPTDVEKDGHILLGWTLDGKPYHFESEITRDITLVAAWSDNRKHRVIYDLNGGSGTAPEDAHDYASHTAAKVLHPDRMEPPAGKVFLYWTCDEENYYPGDLVMVPESDITLKAAYAPAEETTKLKYDYNFEKYGIDPGSAETLAISAQESGMQRSGAKGSGSPAAFHIDYALKNNSRIGLRSIESILGTNRVAGYAFVGWHQNPDCTDPVLTQIQIDSENEENNVVYAEWKKAEPAVPGDPEDDGDKDKDTDTDKDTDSGSKGNGSGSGADTGDPARAGLPLLLMALTLLLSGGILWRRKDS